MGHSFLKLLFIVVICIFPALNCSENLSVNPNTSGETDQNENHYNGTETIYNVKYNSYSKKVFAVGSDGLIIVSSDSGKTWEKIESNVNNFLSDITFLDESKQIVIGESGLILTTEDEGSKWSKTELETPAWLQSISKIDESTLFIVGEEVTIRSTNSGKTWNPVVIDTSGYFVDICFIDEKVGYAIADVQDPYKTIDGGLSWERDTTKHIPMWNSITIRSDGKPFIVGYGYFGSISSGVINGVYGTFSNIKGLVLSLSDIVWTNTYVPGGPVSSEKYNVKTFNTYMALHDIEFHDNKNGAIVGAGGRILITDDGGATWENVENSFSTTFYTVCYLNSKIIIACGSGGIIVRSDNGGRSWSVIN